MKHFILLICLALILQLSHVLAADRHLKDAEIAVLLSNQSLYSGAHGQIEQIFQNNGQTFYLEGSGSSQGFWSVEQNQYCSTWPPNPTKACFKVVDREGEVIFISKFGKEFTFRKTK